VERVKISVCLLLSFVFVAPAGGCEALTPRNPVKTPLVCGYVQSPAGDRLGDFELQLVQNNAVVADIHTDAAGDFRFASVAKGDYYIVSASIGWELGWPIRVTSPKVFGDCQNPLIVQPSLTCGGSVSRKGYHVKWVRQ
jgi:hypothetical protein